MTASPRSSSLDGAVLVARRLLARIEAGHDVHDAAGGRHGVVAKTLHEAAEQHDVDQLLTAAGPLVGQSQVEGLVVQRALTASASPDITICPGQL